MSVPTTGFEVPTPAEPGTSTRRERVGWYFYDWANSAFSTTVISVFLGPYLTAIAENAAGCSGDACVDARVYPLGIPVAPGSLFAYAVSLSVILQVIVLPVVGAIAAQKFPVVAGLARRDNTTMFVSRGVGTIYLPVRINCPPEVAVLTLQPA